VFTVKVSLAACPLRDDEAFTDKMRRLTAQLDEQFTESARLEAEIRKNMQRLGFEVKI
jgi:type I restriction enzyme M protein